MWSTRDSAGWAGLSARCPHVHRFPSPSLPGRPPSARGSRAPDEGDARCTTTFKNAHRTERRDVLYPLHPWFGHDVFVHGATEKANGVFRCTLDGSDITRSLEIPVWMFDRAVCVSEVRFAVDAFVDLEALGALSALLDQVLKTNAPSSNARLRDAYGGSRDRNQGESHGVEDDGVCDRAAQAVSRIPTDGFVHRSARGGGAGLARPAGGRAGDSNRPDDAADTRTCAGGFGADNGGGRP